MAPSGKKNVEVKAVQEKIAVKTVCEFPSPDSLW